MNSSGPVSGFDAPLTLETSSSVSSAPSPVAPCQDESDYFHESDETGSSMSEETNRDRDTIITDHAYFRDRAIDRLPDEMLMAIFYYLEKTCDLLSVMLVNKQWAACAVEYLWHRPSCTTIEKMEGICSALNNDKSFFSYGNFIKRINLSQMGDKVNDGTIHSLNHCQRIERLTLTGCRQVNDGALAELIKLNPRMMALDISLNTNITDVSINAVATNCPRLQGLNVAGCHFITSASLTQLARGCKHIKRIKLNDCIQVNDMAVVAFAKNCPNILEIDLQMCTAVGDVSITSLLTNSRALRELRLPQLSRVTDVAFTSLAPTLSFEALRILDLTACFELTDAGVSKIIYAAPRLRNVVLAKCRLITNESIKAIATLGKNLHYVHLGHCNLITDEGARHLITMCNRIRYIDLGCCANLTDDSVSLLANLPKLKRIGLVKCSQITDKTILKIANACFNRSRRPAVDGTMGPTLERVHLSYCMSLTLKSIMRLLNACRRLTHLSLTGVPAFLMNDFQRFGRDPPREFTEHQREVFCVFSGNCVSRLREYLNTSPKYHNTRLNAGILPRADGGIDFLAHVTHPQMTAPHYHHVHQHQHQHHQHQASVNVNAQVQAVAYEHGITGDVEMTDVVPPFEEIASFSTMGNMAALLTAIPPNPNNTGPYDALLGVDVVLPTSSQFHSLMTSVQGHAVLYEHVMAQIHAGKIPNPPPEISIAGVVIEMHNFHVRVRQNHVESEQGPLTIDVITQHHMQHLNHVLTPDVLNVLFPGSTNLPEQALAEATTAAPAPTAAPSPSTTPTPQTVGMLATTPTMPGGLVHLQNGGNLMAVDIPGDDIDDEGDLDM